MRWTMKNGATNAQKQHSIQMYSKYIALHIQFLPTYYTHTAAT